MIKPQVLFVAPYEKLLETVRLVIAERFQDEASAIQIIQGNLGEGMQTLREALDDGIEVIVSRGGTAKLIATTMPVPVVNIQINLIDVLHVLVDRGCVYGKIGIAGFPNVIYGSEGVGRLLGLEIIEIPIDSEIEAVSKIQEAKASGVEFILGDAISVKTARILGLDGALITSGKEAVYTALKEALLMAEIRRAEKEKSAVLRTVIDQSAEGIVVVDGDGKITMMNPLAEKIFKLSHYDAAGKLILQIAPDFAEIREGAVPSVHQIRQKSYTVRKKKLLLDQELIGTLFSLQNVSEIQALERNIRQRLHKKGLLARHHMEEIEGKSPACEQMKKKAAKFALTDATILVTGESGTGKEVLVQSIHNASLRADGPFVAVNCAALPENLLESELFGYEDGAFTGAKRGGRQGLFELAHGGTIFLDEIGEMPMALQSRLLRVLQEKEVMHIGGDRVIPVDVRVIAATNQDLARMTEEKTFREDLYYRLNILRIQMPSLRERCEDIPAIVRSIMRKMREMNPQIEGIEPKAVAYLQQQEWRGNIRQLSNVIERAMLLSEAHSITLESLSGCIDHDVELRTFESTESISDRQIDADAVHSGDHEWENIQQVLQQEHYNYTRAAARLGIHRTTLWRKLQKERGHESEG